MMSLSKKREERKARRTFKNSNRMQQKSLLAKERISEVDSRQVEVVFKSEYKRIEVLEVGKGLLRTMDFQHLKDLTVRHLKDYKKIILKAQHHYDLFMKFPDEAHGRQMLEAIQNFCSEAEISISYSLESMFSIRRGITTHSDRAKKLAKFSSVVLSKVFQDSSTHQILGTLIDMASDAKNECLFSMQITRAELAAELGTSPDTLFMKQLFNMMDKDRNGFILIKEFWDVMAVLAKGTPEEKARFLFNIYDISQTGLISQEDLKTVLISMMGTEARGRDIDSLLANIMTSINLAPGQSISFDAFFELFNLDDGILDNIHLQCQSGNQLSRSFSLYGFRKPKASSDAQQQDNLDKAFEDKKEDEVEDASQESGIMSELKDFIFGTLGYVEARPVYVIWVLLYTLVLLLVFAERAYYYSVEREHGGLRRIAGYGVTVTRGAASAMMFTYSTLLVTMCRNIFTVIRSSFVHRFFPVDELVSLHRYIGAWALLFTIVHIIGHAINFYHIATQTPSDLTCLFRDFYRPTHVLPKFQYWCWATITGFTGVLLTLQAIVIYVFAYFSRRLFFSAFWKTHNTYPIFYVLMILHGSGNLVQSPFFHFFFLGPAVLFTLDKLISISVSKVKIDVLEAQHLPSNVTLLKIRRPPNFNFQAGQWIRIASLAISQEEYHPFTLSSAPHEKDLTLHIRAIGPWTIRLRKEYPDKESIKDKPGFKYPEIYMDGPFGEGHQTWWDYDVSILVGGGIGVTPFASILKHIAYCSQQQHFMPKTKRVLFLWVTNSQKQFEWLTDILQHVEDQDRRGLIRNHIFITQFKNEFDMRTIFLYMAERHFQRVSGTSLFTGLKAITHFSRPRFPAIFKKVTQQYNFATKIGVFTCGNPSLSASVEEGCREVNKGNSNVIFKHYAENF